MAKATRCWSLRICHKQTCSYEFPEPALSQKASPEDGPQAQGRSMDSRYGNNRKDAFRRLAKAIPKGGEDLKNGFALSRQERF